MLNNKFLYVLTTVALSAFLVAGCGKKDEKKSDKAAPAAKTPAAKTPPAAKPPVAKPPAVAPAGDAVAEATTKFNTLCATCHGKSGKGDGVAAAAMKPKPQDYTDKAWQAKVTDEDLAKAIIEGGPAVGKSPLMPANPDLAAPEKKAVVDELVKMIRAFGK